MTTPPYSLHSWLEDVQGSVLFQEWLRDNTQPESSLHLLLFLRAVDYYRGTNNRSLLAQRAGQVVETFLSSRAKQPIQLDDTVRANVLAQADQVALLCFARSLFLFQYVYTQRCFVFLTH
jgi:hypothetical protein